MVAPGAGEILSAKKNLLCRSRCTKNQLAYVCWDAEEAAGVRVKPK